MSTLKNAGGASFPNHVDYPAGPNFGAGALVVIAADLDGYGAPDVATVNDQTSLLNVPQNAGDGTPLPRVAYPTGAGPYDIAAAELSGDGRPELVVPNRYGASVSVFPDLGNGTFAPSEHVSRGIFAERGRDG